MTSTAQVTLFGNGGYVRDDLLGVQSKDVDFTAVCAQGFDGMHAWMLDQGFRIFLVTPEHFTIRAHFPQGFRASFAPNLDLSRLTADFVLARKEIGGYSDGRHPDQVVPGTIFDDLARRDFTVNAMARDENGALLDPHGGVADLHAKVLRAVGKAEDRIREDALRGIRAIRFAVTKGFTLHEDVEAVLAADWFAPLLTSVSTSRKREEMHKAFRHDTVATLRLLARFPAVEQAVFAPESGLWLKPTQES